MDRGPETAVFIKSHDVKKNDLKYYEVSFRIEDNREVPG
jgi:hypothetical protein